MTNSVERPLRLALPKGRLTDRTLAVMRAAGIAVPEELLQSRKLIHDVSAWTRDTLGTGLEILLLKNTDVPVYVEHGVAELGVAGTDVLYECQAEVFRPYTFGFGSCDIAIAAPSGTDAPTLRRHPWLRVATKYRRYARDHFAARSMTVELIPLSGSVELAPALGLADAILDLVETGKTLQENGLEIMEVIGQTRVKLIANPTISLRTRRAVERLIDLFETTGNTPS